jgi:hypothetical protein
MFLGAAKVLGGDWLGRRRARQLRTRRRRFLEHFHEHRIWLEEDLVAEIQAVNDTLYSAYVDYTTYRRDDPRVQKERTDAWLKAWGRIRDKVPALRGKIEARIRNLLGVVPPTASA